MNDLIQWHFNHLLATLTGFASMFLASILDLFEGLVLMFLASILDLFAGLKKFLSLFKILYFYIYI